LGTGRGNLTEGAGELKRGSLGEGLEIVGRVSGEMERGTGGGSAMGTERENWRGT